jgi:hypothetical protein
VKPGNIPKRSALSEIGEHWIENNCHFLVFKWLILPPPPYVVFPGGDGQQRGSKPSWGPIFLTYTKLNHLKDDGWVSHVENFTIDRDDIRTETLNTEGLPIILQHV